MWMWQLLGHIQWQLLGQIQWQIQWQLLGRWQLLQSRVVHQHMVGRQLIVQ
jgi:hypothetical protein